MPTFSLTGPDGVEYEIDAPDEGAALSAFTQFHQPQRAMPQPSTPGARKASASPGEDWWASAKEFGKGALEGVAASNPIDVGLNVGNLVNQKIAQAIGVNVPEHTLLDRLVSPEARRGLRGWVQDHVTGPADPAHQTAHGVGEFLGGAAGVGLAARGARAALGASSGGAPLATGAGEVLRGFGRDTAAAGAGMGAATVASPVLGYVGAKLGNVDSPETGQAYRAAGELIGELPVSIWAANRAQGLSPQRVAQAMFADEHSPSRLAAAERAGVTPSVGLVGHDTAAKTEDFLASPSYSAGPIRARRKEQFGQMDQLAENIAQDMRGGPSTQLGQIDKSVLGQGAQNLGRTIEENFANQVSAKQQPIIDTMKANLAALRHKLLPNGPSPGTQTGAIGLEPIASVQRVLNEIEAIKKDASISSFQKRHIPELERVLEEDIKTMMGQNPAGPAVGYEALKGFRTALGKRMADGSWVDRHVSSRIYKAATGDMRRAARSQGYPAIEFNRAQRATEELYNTGAQDLAQRLQNPKEGSAANVLFSPTNVNSPSVLETAARFSRDENGVDQLRPVLADSFEYNTRGEGAGRLPPSPETFNPKDVIDYWDNLPERSKAIMLQNIRPQLPNMGGRVAGPGTNIDTANKIADLVDLAKADRRRPSRSLPVGGNSMTGPVTTFGPMVGGIASLLAGSPIGLATSVGSAAGLYGLSKLMTSPSFARYIAAEPVPVAPNPFAANAAIGAESADLARGEDRRRLRGTPPVPIQSNMPR